MFYNLSSISSQNTPETSSTTDALSWKHDEAHAQVVPDSTLGDRPD